MPKASEGIMATYSSISTIDSNNREVFINPVKLFKNLNNVGDDWQVRQSVLTVISVDSKTEPDTIDGILINGDPAVVGKTYTLSSVREEDHYHCIYARNLNDYEMTVKTDVYGLDGNGDLRLMKSDMSIVYVSDKHVSNSTDLFEKNGVSMTDTNSSFLMMRTNPKLSGNIKLVVGKDQTLYLDTFKVSDNLNKYAYRRKSVSASSSYSTDVRNIFKSLPSADLYKVPDADLKAHDPYTSFDLQYDTTYSYGAETNSDELYSENFKILAPLWINRVLPDFFVVFKADDRFNTSTYYNIQNDNEIFDQFLREAKIVKAFDMRSSSPVGKYLSNHYSKISDYPGSVLMQFKEQETQDDTISGINSWIGVSVDTGLIVKMDEDSYFACQTIEKGSQEKLNQFVVGGFERNRLLCPNIINLEFMFDDEDSTAYKMSRYFGLYLKENDFIKYDYVESVINAKTKNYIIKKYDANHKEVDDSVVVSQESVLDNSEYDNRLFFAIGPKSVARLKEQSDLSSFLKSEIANMAYKNYQTCNATRVESGYRNFISMKIKKQIRYGEHFRIVVPSLTAEGIQFPIVFEIVASNDKRLRDEASNITPYISVINSENNVTDYIYYREVPEREDIDNEVFKSTPVEYPTIQAPSFEYLGKTGPITSTEEVEELKQSYYYRAVSGQTFKEFSIRHIVKYETMFGLVDNLKGIDADYYISDDDNDILGTTKYPYIFRLSFYTQDIDDESQLAPLSTQIERLSGCIDALSNIYSLGIKTQDKTQDSLSIVTTYNESYFQHITADILNNDYVSIKSEKVDLGQEVATHKDEEGNGIFRLYDLKYTEYASDDSLQADTTISYFNNDSLKIKMWPLNNQSEEFTGYSMMFAPINFELLGWRKTSIVKMVPFREVMYEMEIEDVNKIIPNTIVNTREGYQRLLDFNITSVTFKTSGIFSNIKDNIKRSYEELLDENTRIYENASGEYTVEEVEKAYLEMVSLRAWLDDIKEVTVNKVKTKSGFDVEECLCLQSPYHLDKWIISSPYEIVMRNQVDLYKPAEMTISLMGIMPVKDFDTEVGVISKTKVTNDQTQDIPPKTAIYIDKPAEDYFLKRNVYYTLKRGSVNGISIPEGSSFVIIRDKIWYSLKGGLASMEINNEMIMSGENGVKISSPQQKVKVSYNIDKPVMQDTKFYVDDNPENDLAYSLVVPTVCSWKGVGMYFDHDSMLSIKGITSNVTKISNGYMCKYSQSSSSESPNMFLPNSLDSLVKTRDGKLVTFREYILNSSITDTINIFLSQEIKPAYTVGYYNKNINTLEFILYGIKYSITFNTNEYVREVQLSNYNKYEIFIFNHFTGEKNEMIINTLENTILLIDHNFNLKKFDDKMTLFTVDKSKFMYNQKYSWISTDKTLVLNDLQFDKDSIYFPTRADASVSPDIVSSNFYQIDFFDSGDFIYTSGKNRITSLFNPQFNGEYIKIAADENVISSADKDSDVTDSSYDASVFRYTENLVSSSVAWALNPSYTSDPYLDSSLQDTEKLDLMREDFMNSLSEDNFIIYVKKMNGSEVSVTKIETSESYTPIRVSTSYPTNVKYNIDFYNPGFKDLVEFDMNESEDLIEKTKTSFMMSNTSFKNISKIKNYYGYKVFNSNRHALDGKNGSMFINKEMSLVSSNWDSGFYRSYTSRDKYKNVDGYIVGIEDKTFFGSKCISLKGAEIKIQDWTTSVVKVTSSNTSNFSTENESKVIEASKTFEFNITQAFYEHFRNNAVPEFSKNWSAFANNTNAINNYIKLSLVSFFRINTANAFRLYCKPSNGQDLLLSMPDDFEDFSEVKNFESKYIEVNDEIVLTVRVTDLSKTYYATYDLKSNI